MCIGGSQALLDAGFRIDHPPPSDTQFGPYWRRQYVFAAATMPVATYMDVGRLIEKFLPNVEWVSSDALHTSKAAVTHSWVEVSAIKGCKHHRFPAPGFVVHCVSWCIALLYDMKGCKHHRYTIHDTCSTRKLSGSDVLSTRISRCTRFSMFSGI